MDFEKARAELVSLQGLYARLQRITTGAGQSGGLLGFALHSETLEVFAIIETDGLEITASPAREMQAEGGIVLAAADALARRKSTDWRHRKGGCYTRLATVGRGEQALVLYASKADETWWLRPRAMFEDGRFVAET